MKLSRRELVLLTVFILLCLAFSYYRFVFSPWSAERKELKSEISTNNEKLKQLKQKQTTEESYISDLKKLDSELLAIERKVPFSKDMPGLFVDLYYLIHENRLEGTSVSFGDITDSEKYRSFDIGFSVKGSKGDIDIFLRKLQSFRNEICIRNISFTASGRKSLGVNITLKAYLQKEAAAGADPEDYDFMVGKYGTFKDLFDMFESKELQQNSEK